MMKKRLSIGLILVIMLVSCTKEDRRALIIKQETAIDEFVKTLVADTVYYRNGVVRAVLKSGISGVEGDTLAREIRFIFIIPVICSVMVKEPFFIPIQTVWQMFTVGRYPERGLRFYPG